jgi:hypothetical protein
MERNKIGIVSFCDRLFLAFIAYSPGLNPVGIR